MYKKFFMGIAAMAALTLVSCSSDDLNSLSDNSSKNEAISFDGYLGRSAVSVNGTRGSVLKIADLQASKDGFGVFGNYSSTGTTTAYGDNLFKNEQVTYSTSSTSTNTNWTYTNTKYWPTEGHIDFLAYAPYVEGKTLTNKSINFDVANKVDEQKDLLWANAEKQTKADNPVKFTFYHALAKIGYSLKQNKTYPNTTIKVTSIKLVGSETTNAFYTKGTIDLSKANKDENLWTIAADVAKQNFDWFTGEAVLTTNADNNKNADDNNLFVIPQDFSATATDKLSVVVVYTVKTGDTTELMNKVSKQITMNFEQGKAYMINLTIGLTPIEFNVTTVEDWTDGGKDDITWN